LITAALRQKAEPEEGRVVWMVATNAPAAVGKGETSEGRIERDSAAQDVSGCGSSPRHFLEREVTGTVPPGAAARISIRAGSF